MSSPAVANSHLGLCLNGIGLNTSAAEIDQALNAAIELGAGGIRIDIPWQAVEWGRNHWKFGNYDYLIEGASHHGLKVDIILGYNNPAYGGQWNQMPTDLAAWSRYVSTVVLRYRGQATSYEVWNEPDLPVFNSDATNPSRYLELLRVTYPIVKSIDAHALVAMAAMAASRGAIPSYWEGISGQAQDFFDIANLHVYTESIAARVSAAARLNPGKPIWVTELGHDAADSTQQAEYIAQAVGRLRAQHVAAVWVFQLRDHVTAQTPRRYGLLDEAWMPRPAAEVFRSLASAWLVVPVRTHDVAITGSSVPKSAKVGSKKTISLDLVNSRYPETVTVKFFKSTAIGYKLIGTRTLLVPVRAKGTTRVSKSYTFTTSDAGLGKVAFRVTATLGGVPDAYPNSNRAVATTRNVTGKK